MLRMQDEHADHGAPQRAPVPPTPLFLAYLGGLALAGAACFRRGIGVTALSEFLVLAAVVTGATLLMFAALLVVAARSHQRTTVLEQARPGAIVVPAADARGVHRAARALRVEVSGLPISLSLLADDTGFEVWSGSPEHPVRLGRAAWQHVLFVRVADVTRWGRVASGLVVTVVGYDGATVELPFVVRGAGLGGLAARQAGELETLVAELRARRTASVRL